MGKYSGEKNLRFSTNGNTRKLWQTLHGVLGDPVSDDSCDHTPDDFATFFTDKVDSVHASTMSTPPVQVDADPGQVDASDY